MKFSKTHTDIHGNFVETMSMELNQDVYIDDVLEAFTRFLRAVGYHFDGNIEIVPEESYNIDLDDDGQDFVHIDNMTPEFEGPVEGFSEDLKSTDWPFPTTTKP